MRYDHHEIARLRALGFDWQFIGRDVGTTAKRVRQAHGRWVKRRGAPPPAVPPVLNHPRYRDYVHPRPFEVTYPTIEPSLSGDVITAVLYGDTHGQFLDPQAEAVFLAILADVRPDVLVHVGDGVDCYSISAFDKDPGRRESLQDEIDEARAHLARARAAAPDAAFYFLEGNHEDRLRRAIWGSERAMRQVVTLREFRRAITWPTLLQLGDLGIHFVPTNEQPLADVLPKFIIKHGNVVRKWSGWSGKGEWERYGKSGASGHVHRLGMFFHRDWNGNHVWVETGCLCSLEPDYVRDPDWQQGLVVATFEHETGAFQVQPVYIHQGSAVWQGRVYRV